MFKRLFPIALVLFAATACTPEEIQLWHAVNDPPADNVPYAPSPTTQPPEPTFCEVGVWTPAGVQFEECDMSGWPRSE